ncbi:hypothetical protein [Sanyastnella coralliicola]|uniref:hypothetical protein n=1 Tax=Sanyastnella coralliicola TaxID=3069118 RepID=UPI0027B911C4|nr:hypothetical protein [Longitalea sp. SCSIO 12813]
MRKVETVTPDTFDPADHWYPSALNATLHPMVAFFLNLNPEQIVKRYCHLHPNVEANVVRDLLGYVPRYFTHSGTDLIHCATDAGNRKMVVIETNSSPSGQKSMPLLDDYQEMGGYLTYVEKTFVPFLKQRRTIKGELAVLYDKNYMEASGYAKAIAQSTHEKVHLIPVFNDGTSDDFFKVEDGVLFVHENGAWTPIRACFRYVTQQPWNRLPVLGRTLVFNPVITCLAGGRNKLVASKAYQLFNAEYKEHNLHISTPETIWDVEKAEIPLWVRQMGGKAVVKIPYSNAGQGVFTIVNEEELNLFMAQEFDYDKFIVQSLIGNHAWSSEFTGGKLYHVGTMPTAKGLNYALDFRMIIHATQEGFRPLSLYSRRASEPLALELGSGKDSWAVLGTNLSMKEGSNQWSSDVARLMVMDRKGFNRLGIGLDDLIDGYLQSVMATVAIDNMAKQLINSKGKLKKRLFKSLNNDESLIKEIENGEL